MPRHWRTIVRPLFAVVLGVALAISTGAARAGDAAARRIIGFSPDANYFAFEQYGTLDAGTSASGWSEIDIIDTRTDQFVGGKPIQVVDASEGATLTLEQAGHRPPRRRRPCLPNMTSRRAGNGRPSTSSPFLMTWSPTTILLASSRFRKNGSRRPMTLSASDHPTRSDPCRQRGGLFVKFR